MDIESLQPALEELERAIRWVAEPTPSAPVIAWSR